MSWARRGRFAAVFLLIAGLGYAAVLTLANRYFEQRLREGLVRRLEATFGGHVTVGALEVALWSGHAAAREIVIERGEAGAMAGEIGAIEAQFARGGAVLLTRELDKLALHDAHLRLTYAALTQLRRPPAARLVARAVELENLVVTVAPSARMPTLLASRLTLHRVASGRTQVRSALSWLESVHEIDGDAHVPLVGDLHLRLRGQQLSLAGSALPRAVEISFAPPSVPAGLSDGERVRAILRYVAQRVATELGGPWALQLLIK